MRGSPRDGAGGGITGARGKGVGRAQTGTERGREGSRAAGAGWLAAVWQVQGIFPFGRNCRPAAGVTSPKHFGGCTADEHERLRNGMWLASRIAPALSIASNANRVRRVSINCELSIVSAAASTSGFFRNSVLPHASRRPAPGTAWYRTAIPHREYLRQASLRDINDKRTLRINDYE